MKKLIAILATFSLVFTLNGCVLNSVDSTEATTKHNEKVTTTPVDSEYSESTKVNCACTTTTTWEEHTSEACFCWEKREYEINVYVDVEKTDNEKFDAEKLFADEYIKEYRQIGIVPKSAFQIKTKALSFLEYTFLIMGLTGSEYVKGFFIPEIETPQVSEEYGHLCYSLQKPHDYEFRIYVQPQIILEKLSSTEGEESDYLSYIESLLNYDIIESYNADDVVASDTPTQFIVKTKEIYLEQFMLLVATINAEKAIYFMTTNPSSDYYITSYENDTRPGYRCCEGCIYDEWSKRNAVYTVTSETKPNLTNDDLYTFYLIKEVSSLKKDQNAGYYKYTLLTHDLTYKQILFVTANFANVNMRVRPYKK